MKKIIFLFLITISVFGQSENDFIVDIKNEDLKKAYNQFIEFKKNSFTILNQSNDFSITSVEENINFFDQLTIEFNNYKTEKNKIFDNFNSKKYEKDFKLIYPKFQKFDSIINDKYLQIFKLIKINENVYMKKNDNLKINDETNLDFSLPSQKSCKEKKLNFEEEEICFNNFIRSLLFTRLSPELFIENEKSILISVNLRVMINKKGKLEFIRFLNSSKDILLDLKIYNCLKKISASYDFISAKRNGENIDFIYGLPLKISFTGME